VSESAEYHLPAGGRAALSEALFRIGALRLGRFTLEDGKTSSYSLDIGVVPSDPEAYALSVAAYLAVLEGMGESSYDALAGAGTAGVMFSSPVAYQLKRPMLQVRGDDAHRKQEQVEGAVRPGWRTVLLGGVIDTAESLASAVESLRRAGCVVMEAVVLVDRLEGGRARLRGAGVTLNAFTDIRNLAETLYERKKITKAGLQSVLRQVEGSGR